MRVLLDECVPRQLGRSFGPEHDVRTVTEMGWAGAKNGDLLELAAASRFGVLVTVDTRLGLGQQLSLPVIVLSAASNTVESLLPLMPMILARLATLQPGRTEIGSFKP